MTYCGTPIKTYVMSSGDNGQLSIISPRHRQNLTAKQYRNPCSGPPLVYMYQDLSTCLDWWVKKAMVNLLIKMNGNSKHTSGNLLSPLGAESKDIHTASQMLLTEVYLRLRCRILFK